jgi:hypothetical protein
MVWAARSRLELHNADGLWEQFLRKAEPMLHLQEYAVVVISMYEWTEQQSNMHCAWVSGIRKRQPSEEEGERLAVAIA